MGSKDNCEVCKELKIYRFEGYISWYENKGKYGEYISINTICVDCLRKMIDDEDYDMQTLDGRFENWVQL